MHNFTFSGVNKNVSSSIFLFQDKFFALVIRVLTAFKTSEIDGAVKTMSSDQIDILMKYIYRGFAEPSEKGSALLLQWHEKVLLPDMKLRCY